MFFHDLPEEIVQVFHLHTQVHLVEFRHCRISVSDQNMVVVRLPVADRISVHDLLTMFFIQPFHSLLRFLCLHRETLKIPDHAELKLIFLPLSPDKCSRPPELPVMAAHRFKKRRRDHGSHIPFSLPLYFAKLPVQERQRPGRREELLLIFQITFPVRIPLFHNIPASILRRR